MLFQIAKTENIIELLNDLANINNDRIVSYRLALEQSINRDQALHRELRNIMDAGERNKFQLIQAINRLNINPKKNTTAVLGKIYRAWTDLKATFTGNTRSSILAQCQYNEQIAVHVYKAALNTKVNMNEETRSLIESQKDELKHIATLIQQHGEIHPVNNSRLVYFN